MKKLSILIFFISTFISSLFAFPEIALASVLFQDDFNDGNADGWTVEYWTPSDPNDPVWQDSKWLVDSENRYGITLNYGDMRTFSSNGDISWTNYVYKVQMLGKVGVDKNIVFRYQDINNWYGFHMAGNSVYFGMRINGNYSDVGVANFSFENNIIYNLKIVVKGNSVSFYANDIPIVKDYVMWNNPLPNGKIALYVSSGAILSSVWFDNVIVCDSEPCEPTPTITPTPPLLVPYLSQKIEPWGSEEYNQASLWAPTQPTISRWGCALTSGAMTLLYYGINKIPGGENLNPGSLNNWLKNQTDGYLREGHLNWHALTRLSKIMHEEISSPILEFRRSGKDFSLLDNDLVNNHPPILEVPGHFIVSTGKTNGSYLINDPAWSEKTTLEAYNNDFISMRRLLPTSTNLSALLFVVDPHVNLTLTDRNGNSQGEFYFEGPLTDDISGEIGGKGINILNYNQPPEGEYAISVTASTSASFNLDIYSYDQEANPTAKSFFGFTNPNNPATFSLIEKEGGESENIQRTSTFSRTKQDILESQKSGMITKIGIAKVLLTKINRAEKLKNKGKINETKIILKDFLRELEIYFKKGFIKPKAYLLLKEDVEYLLSTL